jgi:hypothetical protein
LSVYDSEETNPEQNSSNLPEKSPHAVEEYNQFPHLLESAYGLLRSDFTMSGIEIDWPESFGKTVFDLRKIIAAQLHKSGGPTTEAFYRLLYRADIRESDLKNALNNTINGDFNEAISEIFIIRALQRAFFREKYRS